MKLALFDDFKLGVVQGDQVFDVSAVVAGLGNGTPQSMMSALITDFESYRSKLEAAAKSAKGVPVSQVKFRPPLPKPVNLVCMAVNYMEDGTLEKKPPISAFLKSPYAVIGDNETMVLPDADAAVFEGEAEMALVIGKTARNVPASEAFNYIFGYMNFIDGSARMRQRGAGIFYDMKSRDTFAPCGPYLVTADEVGDPEKLQVKLWNNGVLKQNFNTDDMAHKIARTIEWVSSTHTLEPGDIIATGTNHRGLNAFQDGDKIELEVEGLGRLTTHIKDELKRTWTRETRLERTQAGEKESMAAQLSGKYTPTAS